MTMFTLPDDIIDEYERKEPNWGFRDIYGTPVGEVVFLRTYSRKKEDGTKETWVDVCRRVIEGTFTIQKRHCEQNRLPWDEQKAQRTARDAFDRMFNFKWLPPGRGLWMMGAELVMNSNNSAALNNCGFTTTGTDNGIISDPLCWLMEASMLGIGVGFDTDGQYDRIAVSSPNGGAEVYTIPDTREGWVESVRLLIDSYTDPGAEGDERGNYDWEFDYSQIRPAGVPIKTFGGTAAGPEPLMRLHDEIRTVLNRRAESGNDILTGKDIADLGNLIGVCVVSGNVRRSAELLLGDVFDEEFLNLKNYDVNPDRVGHGWMSNNSVRVSRSVDLSGIVEGIERNGEPGVVWMDNARQYGRFIDGPDYADMDVKGFNPCVEIGLNDRELCTLSEVFLDRHDSMTDFIETLKVAYLYGKTVTLIPTHWERTNAVMQRNRRIGLSVSGVANFLDANGITQLKDWLDDGYKFIQDMDKVYSDWLCVRESIRTTTVKPSGSISLLSGSSPGAHWPVGGHHHIRRVTFAADDPTVERFRDAGYTVEDSVYTPGSVVVEFPIESKALRSEQEVDVWSKFELAATLQELWSDNGVSVTVSYDKDSEADEIGPILQAGSTRLKAISFLPMGGESYAQMPYENLNDKQWQDRLDREVFPVDLTPSYGGAAKDAVGEAYCTTDKCEMPNAEAGKDAAAKVNLLGIEVSNDE